VAAFGVAAQDCQLVADEFAEAFGKDRRTAGEICVLLPPAAREGHLNRRLFRNMLRMIAAPPHPDG